MKDIKHIWVLYGGKSSEREVSLNSGRNIAAALEKLSFDVQLHDVKDSTSLAALPWNESPDLVFLGLHGTFGEDGTVQGYLSSMDIPFVGSACTSSALCFDKISTKLLLHSCGIPCIPSFHLFSEDDLEALLKSEDFRSKALLSKQFIKPSREGSTIGISRFDPSQHDDPEIAFRQMCKDAFGYDSRVLIEEWVEGKELTVALLDGKALPVVEICPNEDFYDYEHKYTKGKTEYFCPARIDEELAKQLQAYAERAYVVLENKDYCRMDFLLDQNNQAFALEMNTLPGMTDTSLVPMAAKAKGLSYEEFLAEVIKASARRITS